MKRAGSFTPEQRKHAFLNTLTEVQDEFEKKGIDYRIIGSLASHAYLGLELDDDVTPLDYDRKGAATADQQVPDIDMIVPRVDLSGAREIRANTLTSAQPVKLGLANPTTEIDYRPDGDQSFLTHKNIHLPVASELFRAEEGISLEGVPIKTIPLDTLIHTFGTFGGKVRQKDLPIIKALMRKSDQSSDPRTDVFHDFQSLRRELSPREYKFSLAVETFNNKAPRRLKNELYRVALVAADILGKR
jgi:hypothetical protein